MKLCLKYVVHIVFALIAICLFALRHIVIALTMLQLERPRPSRGAANADGAVDALERPEWNVVCEMRGTDVCPPPAKSINATSIHNCARRFQEKRNGAKCRAKLTNHSYNVQRAIQTRQFRIAQIFSSRYAFEKLRKAPITNKSLLSPHILHFANYATTI